MLPRPVPSQLETDRLILRAFRPEDRAALRELWSGNRERFLPSFPDAVAQLSDRDGAADYIRDRSIAWCAGSGFWYGIWDRSTPVLIGQIHVKHIDWDIGRVELAYLLGQEFEGNGLASEAVRRIHRDVLSGPQAPQDHPKNDCRE